MAVLSEEGRMGRLRPRKELVDRGWRPIEEVGDPETIEYCKEYGTSHGHTYYLFAREHAGRPRLHLAYLLEAATLELVSAALTPSQIPDAIRAAAEADLAAAAEGR